MKILKLFFVLYISNLINSLHFDISTENQRCYYEELFEGSVAIIKFTIWSSPNSVDKCIFN
jgi:hypothetical protein